MHINAHTAISTPSLLLVPYSSHHVPLYHAWMQSPSLQAATASEPLTVDEEYAMQASWRRDGDKLTFILCLPPAQETPPSGERRKTVRAILDDAPERMIGDVNLFLVEPETEIDEDASTARPRSVIGELELMIASPEHRRKGNGRAALRTFISYIVVNWESIAHEYGGAGSSKRSVELMYLRVKIQESNVGSVRLFEGLGFSKVGDGTNYFGEVELRLSPERLRQAGDCTGADELGYEVEEEVLVEAMPSERQL